MTALVTGGGRGLGAALAARFAADGHRVVVADLDVPEPPGPDDVRCDVTDPADLERAVAAVGAPIDVLCLNAGIGGGTAFGPAFDRARYRAVMAVNVDGVTHGLAAAWEHLVPGSVVLVTASLAGLAPSPGDVVYAMTKHAVVGLVRSAAADLAARGGRIHALCPGFVDTDLVDAGALTRAGLAVAAPTEIADAAARIAVSPDTGLTWALQAGRDPVAVPPPPIELAAQRG